MLRRQLVLESGQDLAHRRLRKVNPLYSIKNDPVRADKDDIAVLRHDLNA